jgi:predicted TPR repeat methyltransferase
VSESPDDPRARHALAAYSGRDVPQRCGDDYVRTVFDEFAESFEAKLKRLDYRAPDLVADALAATAIAPARSLDILDVGCGTGLCAARLAPYARRLIGVDLSMGMLAHARQKHVYTHLVQAELTAYLQGLHAAFDVIVSADTLVYFGPLDAVITAAARALRPGGVLVFTVEQAVAGGVDYELQLHGRFSHGAAYIERLLREAGLQPFIDRAELRKEGGVPVAGLVVRATAAQAATLPLTTAAAAAPQPAAPNGEHHAAGD